MAGIGLSPRRSMVAEDIRNLQRRARHASGGRGVLQLILLGHQRSEAIEWALDLADRVGRRGLELGVPERPRAIMRSFYVIESQRSAEQNWLLAGAAKHPARDTRQHPRP